MRNSSNQVRFTYHMSWLTKANIVKRITDKTQQHWRVVHTFLVSWVLHESWRRMATKSEGMTVEAAYTVVGKAGVNRKHPWFQTWPFSAEWVVDLVETTEMRILGCLVPQNRRSLSHNVTATTAPQLLAILLRASAGTKTWLLTTRSTSWLVTFVRLSTV